MGEPAAVTPSTSMRTFFTVWGGQLVSILGSTMSAFGLQLWVYAETGSVTNLALVALAFALPAVLISPFAGALVDRWDRRKVMLASDAVAGVATLCVAGLYATDSLHLWHIYVLVAVGSMGSAFQAPAWLASIPLLVPKPHLGRANGLVQLNDGLSLVMAPALAGVVLVASGLGAILLIDVATFLFAVGTLAVVRFPRPEGHAATSTGSMLGDAAAGWRYVRERGGLFGLLWVYAGVNFSLSFGNVLFIPLVVAFASESAAGGVLSAAGFGAVAGSVAVSAWGGPKKRVRGTMIAIVGAGLGVALAGVRPSLVLVAASAFALMAMVPVANTSSQVLWQLKVPPAMQGRVFAIRRMISQAISPIAILASGPLADRVFEPLMAEGGALAGSVGSVIGVGPGRGVGLMFIVTGLLTALLGVVGYLAPRVRNIETELPDYVAG
ncbi:MAG TPA: MFS transporter [Acidimicrobiia bacterium]|nr:MFS transporter [Acidimicrobiia bacterium]